MEIVSHRGIDAPPPPLPEEGNPMSLGEAVGVINAVLASQYRAFDKLRAVLTAAQKAAANQADVEKLVHDLGEEALKLDREVDDARQRLRQTQNLAAEANTKFEAQKQAQIEALVTSADQAERALVEKLAARQMAMEGQLSDELAAGRGKLANLKKAIALSQTKLDSLTAAIETKTNELAAEESRLSTAVQALTALKAKL